MDLAEFLLARIAEDEAVAQTSEPNLYNRSEPWRAEVADSYALVGTTVARWLAECEAKRRIVNECLSEIADGDSMPYGGGSWLAERTLQCLALPYADHPDYRQEWRP